jgi:hypothetical protein
MNKQTTHRFIWRGSISRNYKLENCGISTSNKNKKTMTMVVPSAAATTTKTTNAYLFLIHWAARILESRKKNCP